MKSHPEANESIPHAKLAGKAGFFLSFVVLGCLSGAPLPAQSAAPTEPARIKAAPEEVLRAEVPEEPDWAAERAAQESQKGRAAEQREIARLQAEIGRLETALGSKESTIEDYRGRVLASDRRWEEERDARREAERQVGLLQAAVREMSQERSRSVEASRADTPPPASSPMPEPPSCEEESRVAYARGLQDAEKTWRVRMARGEDAAMQANALMASLEGLEKENARLHALLEERPRPLAAGSESVEEAYQRGRREAELAFRRAQSAQPTDPAEVQRRKELEDRLAKSQREQANTLHLLREKEAEINTLRWELRASAEDLRNAKAQLADPSPSLPVASAGDTVPDVDERVARCEREKEQAIAEANRRAAKQLDQFFSDLNSKSSARETKIRNEEFARADKVFRRVLHTIQSREDRKAARELWEELR